mgnify:FL=1
MNQDEVILTFLKEFKSETKEDLAQLRKSNHDINNELNGVNGQLMLLRQSQEIQKEDMEAKFQRVHARIDKEQETSTKEVQEVKKSLEAIASTLSGVVPKVSSWDDTLKIAKKVVVTAVTVAVLGLLTSKMTGII